MSSNFTASDLRTGLTMPIKLRNIIERPATGQNMAFNKLAELITCNFVAGKGDKENKERKRLSKESKNIRINSIKQPSLPRPKSIQHQQQCFKEFFEYFASNNQSQNTEIKFKPYRQQEAYVAPQRQHHVSHVSVKTRKKAATVNKKYDRPVIVSRPIDSPSIFGEWQIEQQKTNFSVLFKNHSNE